MIYKKLDFFVDELGKEEGMDKSRVAACVDITFQQMVEYYADPFSSYGVLLHEFGTFHPKRRYIYTSIKKCLVFLRSLKNNPEAKERNPEWWQMRWDGGVKDLHYLLKLRHMAFQYENTFKLNKGDEPRHKRPRKNEAANNSIGESEIDPDRDDCEAVQTSGV